jgi:hypothetical protein
LTRLLSEETLAAAVESELLLVVESELPDELLDVPDEAELEVLVVLLVEVPEAILYIMYVLLAIAEIVDIMVPSFLR